MRQIKYLFLILSTCICNATYSQAPGWRSAFDDYLKDIQSHQTNELGYPVYSIATTWMAAGFVDQANQLLTTFWSYRTVDPDEFRNIHDGFLVMWALSGRHPDSLPFQLRNIDDIVQSNWDGFVMPYRWAAVFRKRFEDRPWTEISDSLLCPKAILLSYDGTNSTHRSSREQRSAAVNAFARYFASDLSKTPGTVLWSGEAAIIAASIDDREHAISYIRATGLNYLQRPESLNMKELMADTSTARLLLDGTLAPVWGITKSSCDSGLAAVKAVLKKRVENGPSLVYGDLSLKDLLRRISVTAIALNDQAYDKNVQENKWLGYTPATESQVAATERRLRVHFPDDYRALLLLTNGFRASSNIDPSFLPVEKVGYLRDLDRQLVDIWTGSMEKNDPDLPRFRRSILVGGLNEEQQFLLVPPGDGEKEWRYWSFATWHPGTRPYYSLRYFLEDHLRLFGNELRQKENK
jgi:hypothetical protein